MTVSYTGDVKVGGGPQTPRARAPDDHQGRGRRADVQQRLPAPVQQHRRPGPHRRGCRARDPAPPHRRRRASPLSSPRTSTGTTTARSAPSSTPTPGSPSPGSRTPTRSRPRPACPSPAPSPTATPSQVGDCTLEVIAIAGHTPGSIALLYDDSASEGGHPHLFTGDSLFPGGVGNTFGDESAFQQLIDDVETKLFARLPDDTWFYPGHGNDSTLGVERPHLAEWRERGW